MKQLNPIFALAALLLAANACEQNPVQDPDKPQAPYYLSVDKSVIEADGKETATITLKDATGLVLTDEAHIKNVSLYVKETDTYFTRRTNTFTSIDNGDFTIEGMYLGTPCEAPVVVTAQNRAKYEVFKKKVAIYRNTATWCVNCPSMTSALDNVDNYTKERSALLCFHGDQYYGLKSNGNFLSEYILSTFGLPGYPSAVYSLSLAPQNRARNDIMAAVKQVLLDHPATTGIKAESSVSGNTVSVKASVKASKAGRYDLGIALVQDNMPGTSDSYEEVYHHVVRSISGNYMYMSTNAFDLGEGEEKSGIEFADIQFDSANIKDCRLVLFTLVKADSTTACIIDNVVEFPVGESVDYVYN